METKTKILVTTGLILFGMAGFTGGVLEGDHSSTTNAVQQPSTGTKIPVKTIAEPDVQPNGATWNGMEQANSQWLQKLFQNQAYTAQGVETPLQNHKALLFTAPWCPYCHETLLMLQQNHLLNKVTVVNLAIEYRENAPELPIHTISQAIPVVAQDMKKAGIDLLPSQTLYSMPGGALDQAVHGFPTLLVQHQGKWFVFNGFVNNPAFWEHALQL